MYRMTVQKRRVSDVPLMFASFSFCSTSPRRFNDCCFGDMSGLLPKARCKVCGRQAWDAQVLVSDGPVEAVV
jgi:hypothetical protein